MHFVLLGQGIPLNKLFKLGGGLFLSPTLISRDFDIFLGFLKRISLENPLHNLTKVTESSEETFYK